MDAAFDPAHSGYDTLADNGLQLPDFSQGYPAPNALVDPTATLDPLQQNSSGFDPASSSNLDGNLTSFDQHTNPASSGMAPTGALELQPESFPAASTSFDLHPDPLHLQDNFYQTGTQDYTLPQPQTELLFGISTNAGQTDSGDNVVWSTAETAGGAYYNERTGEEVEPS